jgi:hypothetical protein
MLQMRLVPAVEVPAHGRINPWHPPAETGSEAPSDGATVSPGGRTGSLTPPAGPPRYGDEERRDDTPLSKQARG